MAYSVLLIQSLSIRNYVLLHQCKISFAWMNLLCVQRVWKNLM